MGKQEDAAAWAEMWDRKADGREMFAQATLTKDVEFQKWNNGNPETLYTKKAGDRVLITLVSRFGHACIRGFDIDQEKHGYDSTIDPSHLTDIKFLSDGGRPWRKEMEERFKKGKP